MRFRSFFSFLVTFIFLLPVAGTSLETTFDHGKHGGYFKITLTDADFRTDANSSFRVEPVGENIFDLFLIKNGPTSTRSSSTPRMCKVDLRVLTGAIQMYNMDNARPLETFDPKIVPDLIKKGYIRQIPESMRLGCVFRSKGDLSKDGELLCEIHGGLNDPEKPPARTKPATGTLESRVLHMYGRFLRPGESTFRLISNSDEKVLFEGKIQIPATPQQNPGIAAQWREMDRSRLEGLSLTTPGETVFSYISRQAQRREAEGQNQDLSEFPSGFPSRNRDADLYSLTTGALAIQESLQLDRMVNQHAATESPSLPIQKLHGPEVKSHPFKSMIGSRNPTVYPIDFLVPAEFYSCHFSNISKQIAFSDLLDQWGTGLLQTIEVSARDGQIKAKLLGQLCLEMTELTRLFGDNVIDDLTICGADPFLQEGTDVSVIFHIKNATVFDLNASKNFVSARKDYPQAREEKFSHAGVEIYSLTTPDRRLHSFSCTLGEFKVFSNSRMALERIVDCAKETHASLGKADDYRYMRTVFPANIQQEDVFFYLSDSHIRQLVGPVWKIGRQRRLQCANSLKMIQNALTLFTRERDSGIPTIDYLLKEKYQEPAYLICPDGGTYQIDPKTNEPFCRFHGRDRYLVPILDSPPDLINKTEEKEYQTFLDAYNRYWVRFFDPVGIRAQLGSGGVTLETCILPLIENSIYDSFVRISGEKPVQMTFPTHPRTIFQLFAKLNLQTVFLWDSRFERDIRDLVPQTGISYEEFLDSLGDGISLNVVDSDPKFSFDFSGNSLFLSDISRDFLGVIGGGFFLTSLNMPTYVAVKVRDEKKIERFIRDALALMVMKDAARNQRGSFFPIQTFYYGTRVTDKAPHIYTLDVQLMFVRFHYFFSVFDGNLFIANKRNLIQEIFENPGKNTPADGNLVFRVVYDSFNQLSATTKLTWQEKMRQVCVQNHGILYALSKFRHIPSTDWGLESMLINGYSPFCPAGGTYSFDKILDKVQCSVHGDFSNPRQPFEPDPANPLNKFMDQLRGLNATLSVTPEGIMTRVNLQY